MYDTCAAYGIDGRLIDAIRNHGTANPGRTAYVVSGSEFHEQPERQDERFVVVALPDIPAEEINHTERQVRVEVRSRPDGTDIECLMLADGAVAISGRIVQAAGADTEGRMLVAWLFADSIELSEYALANEDIWDMQAAQQVAQSHGHLTLEATSAFKEVREHVIEVFQYVSVAVEPLQ
jgi:hypothetical protein